MNPSLILQGQTPRTIDEVLLKKIAIYIVWGGLLENILKEDNKIHLMPRSYIDNLISENLYNLDGVEY